MPASPELEPGTAVFGIVGGGAQAEFVRVPAAHCARVPPGLDLVTMGGVPEAYVTAHDALVTRAHVAPDEWVLIHAVGSGVGTAGLQLAQAFGARVVGTARTADKLERCRPLGLAAGIVAESTDGALAVDALVAAIVEATDGGVDVVLDLVGGRYVEADIAAATLKGRIVLIGALAGSRAELDVLTVMSKRLSVVGTMLPRAEPRRESGRRRCIRARRRPIAGRRHDRAGRGRGPAARSGRRGLRAAGVGRDVRQGHPRLSLNVSASGAGQRISIVTVRVDAFPVLVTV